MIKKLLSISLFLGIGTIVAQQSYYNGLDLNKTGVALKNELATKIINTHTKVLTYGWDATKATDINPNNAANVLLIYGWENGSDSDCTNDLERSVNSNGGSSCDFNREHVYPKSLGTPTFGNNTAPGADGHHIRASDVQRNGQRGNQKFADGSGNSKNVTGGWYPGDEWKGDVARIIMYMYLRYGSQCLPTNVGVGSAASTPDDMIDLFLKWNAEDPVSQVEDNRNKYHENTSNAFAQGNRNPFIDNPHLATRIWGGPAAQNRWATASVSEISQLEQIKIHPNPSSTGTIHIKVPAGLHITKLTVYSILGKKIVEQRYVNPQQKLQINSLTNGLYLLKINSTKHSTTKKIIVR